MKRLSPLLFPDAASFSLDFHPIANGCYRRLAQQRKGFDNAKPKLLYCKFVETAGRIEVAPDRRLLVTFDRRSHNPILREAALDQESPRILAQQPSPKIRVPVTP